MSTNPLPGEVGGPIVGYAEAERVKEEATKKPTAAFSSLDAVQQELEKQAGKPFAEITEAEFYRMPVKLKAQNLAGGVELTVKFKDPAMTGHWFNHKNGNGKRVTEAIYQGFTPCTKEDVEAWHSKVTDDTGALVYGDLVLMKIPKVVLWSRQKDHQDTAKARVNRMMSTRQAAPVPGEVDKLPVSSLPDGADYFVPNLTQAQRVDGDEARRLVYQD